jgi:2-amino-4-hydroxy-6-hydroxymethyldihydropteridine diphosphokinase|tara:strand:- start:366 stop:875 length:510 start_codon:yes stop_codon:yes gene_type:complete
MVNQPTKETEVFLSLGSNIDPEENLKYACRELKKTFGNIQISSVYKNKPIGFEGNDFLNMVVKIKSTFNLNEMLDYLRCLEVATGRDIGTGAFDSRTLDIDMILYSDLVHPEKPFKIPRNDIELYSFVLCPLAEINPDGIHPVTGKAFKDLWENFDQEEHSLSKVSIDI